METLLTILFFIGAALVHSWMKKKEENQAETGLDQPPREGQRSRPARPVGEPLNWEEELRRLLQGEQPTPPPPVAEPTRPAPPPLMPSAPPYRPSRAFQPPTVRTPPPAPVMVEDEGVGLPVQFPGLRRSAEAYERASHIDFQIEKRMREVAQRVTTHAPQAVVVARMPESQQSLAVLRDPRSLRSAMVASMVLGPPKALEN